MSGTDYSMSSAGDMDDLPRTLRRERERQKAAASGSGFTATSSTDYPSSATSDDFVPAAVQRIEVPFVRLVVFFIKAMLAAIPALILFGVMVWGAMEGLKAKYPDLIQTKIIICSPSNPKC